MQQITVSLDALLRDSRITANRPISQPSPSGYDKKTVNVASKDSNWSNSSPFTHDLQI